MKTCHYDPKSARAAHFGLRLRRDVKSERLAATQVNAAAMVSKTGHFSLQYENCPEYEKSP
jgi:hypothetical protein